MQPFCRRARRPDPTKKRDSRNKAPRRNGGFAIASAGPSSEPYWRRWHFGTGQIALSHWRPFRRPPTFPISRPQPHDRQPVRPPDFLCAGALACTGRRSHAQTHRPQIDPHRRGRQFGRALRSIEQRGVPNGPRHGRGHQQQQLSAVPGLHALPAGRVPGQGKGVRVARDRVPQGRHPEFWSARAHDHGDDSDR